MRSVFSFWMACCIATWVCAWANAADIKVPASVTAGQSVSISLSGSGKGTLYLFGPDHVLKRSVSLGDTVQLDPSDIRTAGRYQVIVCDGSCTSTNFNVTAAQPADLSFFLHPSRVPVSSPNSIDATTFVFDRYHNLVMTPVRLDFRIKPASGAPVSRQASTQNGIVSMRMDSTPREGKVQVTAALGSLENTRVIQQVAAEACQLRMRATPNGEKVNLETDPIRDCSGNALPDGTTVSFTQVDRNGRSTVDTPIKKGIARAQFRVAGPARISIACGVVVGNEVTLGGKS